MIDWRNIYTHYLKVKEVKVREIGSQYHKHHVVPRYMDRSSKNTKVVLLKLEDHATAHWLLFKLYGKIQDKYAWYMLSGKTERSEEFRKLLSRQTPESIAKMLSSREKNQVWKPNKGEDNGMSKLTEENILHIYSLIKKMYSDREIIEKLKLNVKNGAIHAVRTGAVWNDLWKLHLNRHIPSFFKNGPAGLSARTKLAVFKWIDQGYTITQISRHTKITKYDILYATQGRIWKKIREYYLTNKNK